MSLSVVANYFAFKVLLAVLLFLVFSILEIIADTKPSTTARNAWFNYGSTLIYLSFDSTLGLGMGLYTGWIIKHLHNKLNILQAKPGIPFLLLLILLSSLIGDFAYYWLHRLQHKSKWLWAIHELHHSDECVNVSTSFRMHWLEIPLRNSFGILPAMLLPRPMIILPAIVFVGCTTSYLTHSNIPIGYGWLNRVFVSPKTHRIHHSIQPEHIDKNFAGTWNIFDLLFGTYVHPKKGEHPRTGLLNGEVPRSFLSSSITPFKTWARLIGSR